MNLETRKLSFIQEILKIQSEKTIAMLETILKNAKETSELENIEPMSVEEFNQRIDKSLEDSKKGNLTEVEDLISEIEKWS
ncbi:hypothetical protein SLW70_13575 [Flavobacterium sp. NG2]|uniref:hypothetical protein n=1 Tax=Flavobacterium sp. NG2 TaxID=3097547 RepID=UPI002A819971|nr:hypothetical protein [Flavobacterium sp. NG2]WPR70953.1 hypothetical protein SLW70_13575 [Flavobacterium sp. NG2]